MVEDRVGPSPHLAEVLLYGSRFVLPISSSFLAAGDRHTSRDDDPRHPSEGSVAFQVGRSLGVASSLVLLWCAGAVVRSQDAPSETAVKAAFLFNFSKYVGWPASAAEDASQAFPVCVIADEEFTEQVRLTIEGEKVDGRPLTAVRPRTLTAARQCRMLFVGDGEMNRAAPLLRGLRDTPVLTVGESPEFLDQGGVIAFVRVGRNVRFDVNRATAQRHGLTISSQLLRLARNVREP